MPSKSIEIVIPDTATSNGWKNLNTLVQSAFAADNKPAPRSRAATITLINTTYATADSRLQWTRDPTNTESIGKGLLPEESRDFSDPGAYNSQSMLDVWIRMTAGDGTTLIAGTASVELLLG